MNKKIHPYHVVEPSVWPILTALALLVTVIGVVLKLHANFPLMWVFGLLGIAFCAGFWWKDIVSEKKYHTTTVVRGLRLGMVFFIVSEVCFFAAFFWAFFHSSLFPQEATGFQWPPKGIEVLNPFDLPYLNTLILLLSGSLLTWSHQDLIDGKLSGSSQKMFFTIILGLMFTCLQGYEYHHVHFAMKDGIYPSIFFITTGFHGVHVVIGTIFLLVILMRMRWGQISSKDHMGYEAAAWYWHFVDAVWLFLFVFIYIWGS